MFGVSRFAVGDAGSFLEALRSGGLTGAAINSGLGGGALGAAGLYNPERGLVGTSIDNGFGLGALGLLGGFGGFGRSGRSGRSGGSNDEWLNRVYQRELGRDVGDPGKTYWGNELDQGASRRDVRDNIWRSDEAWLNRTYKDLLGRGVGDAGRTYWGDELAGGASRESVRDNIMRSDEYRTYQDSLDAEGANNSIGHWDPPFGHRRGASNVLGNVGGLLGGFGGIGGSGRSGRSDGFNLSDIAKIGGIFCDERLKIDIAPLENTEVNDELAQMSFFVKALKNG